MKSPFKDENVSGNYGSFAFRSDENRNLWNCYESSDYHYLGVVDDFGNLVAVSAVTNMRGY